MGKFNTSLVVGLTFVATLGGLLFGWDTAVIFGGRELDYALLHRSAGVVGNGTQQFVRLDHLECAARVHHRRRCRRWISTALGRKGGLIIAALLFLHWLARLGGAGIRLWRDRPDGPAGPAAVHLLSNSGRSGCGHRLDASPLYIAEISPSAIRVGSSRSTSLPSL